MFVGKSPQKPCRPMENTNKKCTSAISEEALTPAGGLAERQIKRALLDASRTRQGVEIMLSIKLYKVRKHKFLLSLGQPL